MASIRKRGTRWQVQIRRQDCSPLSRSFKLREDALKWAREQERLIDLGRRASGGELVFPIPANAFRLAWERVRRRAGVENLRFHDLRHEAISRFFEMGLTMPEVALISGHKDARMLFRYVHLKATDVARKLMPSDE